MTQIPWKKGRGKLGILDPLLGEWQADAVTPLGPLRCTRKFARILGRKFVLLEARWEFPDKMYEEHALYGVGDSGGLEFWSFVSDGKRSHGVLVAASDVHSEAIAFEAQMPAGMARTIYWPAEDGGINWAVEAKTQKGWNRFVHHLYRRRS